MPGDLYTPVFLFNSIVTSPSDYRNKDGENHIGNINRRKPMVLLEVQVHIAEISVIKGHGK